MKGITISFRRCECTSILGSSGSGKTTLLNIIGGLDQYDSGDLMIEGFIAGSLGVGIAFIIDGIVNGIAGLVNKNYNHIASMPLGSAVVLILLSILLNVLAGSRPARMAANKDPVEALRTE